MTDAEPREARPRSVRFSFAFDDTGIRLVGRCPRQKPAPRGDDVRAVAPPHAVVVELRGREGEVLYRQTLISPIPQGVEVIGPGGTMSMRRTAPARGAFTMVVPNLPDAATVVLSRGPDVRLRQAAFARLETTAALEREALFSVPFEGRP